MQLDPEKLRQHYDRLSDDALLEIPRGDLVDLAREIYDSELARRGLKRVPAAPPAPPEEQFEETGELALLTEFDDANETLMARSLLESAGIPCWSKGEPAAKRASIAGLGPHYLLVRRESVDEALELLATPLSDEELAAQAEAAGPPPED